MPIAFGLLRAAQRLLATLAAALAVAGPARPAEPEALPAAAFYARPAIVATALSPSGRWLAMTAGVGGRRVALLVFDLEEWKAVGYAAQYSDADVARFHWVGDDRLVYTLTDQTRGSGDQRWGPGLFSVRRDGSETHELVRLEWLHVKAERRLVREGLDPSHELLHVPESGDEVIVGEHRFTASGEPDTLVAKRLNVVTGRTTSVSVGAPPHVLHWWFDPRGEPRAVRTRHKGIDEILWRADGAEGWRSLASFPTLEAPFEPLFVDSGGTLYVSVEEGAAQTSVLKRFDSATGRPEAEPLVRARGFDFNGHLVSETQGSRVLGVHLLADAETTVWFDKRLKALQAEADQRLPGHVNRLTCRRCDQPDMTVVVDSQSDRDPGQLWIYRAKEAQWRQVGARRPDIDPARMATLDFARFPARDGLEIPVWLTLPPGPRNKPRPAVVLVHGGPWLRHGWWHWDANAQFLASRGYVVIEPEFRGSLGYGARLFQAGWKQWGRAMQDDVADALAWAVAKGYVDAQRVCIAGASYGGYATLMGLARHPDLYRCGVAWVAVTDPRLMYQYRPDSDIQTEWREFDLPQLVGDPVADAKMLDSVSPVLLAERIKAPLLLAFGSVDRRVPLVHGQRMREALEAAGHPPKWVAYDDEGHGWNKLDTRLDFARRLEDFLAEELR